MDKTAHKISIIAVLIGVFGVGLELGYSLPLISLFMERCGFESTVIGLNTATSALVVLITGPFVASLTRRLGTVPTLLLGRCVAACGLVLFPYFSYIWLLFLLRALIGFGTALSWIVSETWISILPPENWRGRVITAYGVLFGAGLSMGPLLLYFIGIEGTFPFMIGALLLLSFSAPAAMMYRHAPAISRKRQRVRIFHALRLSPVGIMAAFLCGVAEQSLLGLLPLWGLGSALSTEVAVLLTNLFALGGVLLVLPVGWLADKLDRFKLLIGMVCIGGMCTLTLPLMTDLTYLLFATMLGLGGAVAAFYTLGLVLIGETGVTLNSDLISLNTVFIMAYTVGMVVGPVATGAGMGIWKPNGLMIVLTVLFFLFIPTALWFRRRVSVNFKE